MATVNVGVLEAVLRLKDTMSPGLNNAGKQLRQFGAKAQTAGASLTRGISLPLAAMGGLAVKAAIDFESSFAGVRKTVDATEAEFQNLAKGFRALALEIPVSVNQLNNIGEAAGQLGIKTENILDFTKTMAQLGVATNLSAEEAATSLARLANITGMAQDDFDKLGSTVVGLGNNFATTEAEIVEFGLRIAGAGAQIGLTEGEILGLGTALSSVGIGAEAGGTAISKVMIQIASAVSTGGAELDQFAEIASRTGRIAREDFAQAFEEDAAGAIVTFIEGLGTLDDAGINTFAVLEDLGMSEIRVRDAMLRASGAGDLLREAVEEGNTAWTANLALTKEAAERFKTTASRLTLLKNKLVDVGIELGVALLPMFERLVDMADAAIPKVRALVQGFAALPTPMQNAAIGAGVFVAALGPMLFVTGAVSHAFGTLLPLLGVLKRVLVGVGGGPIVKFGSRLARIATSAAGLRGVLVTLGRVVVGFSNPVSLAATAVALLVGSTETGRRVMYQLGRVIKNVALLSIRPLISEAVALWGALKTLGAWVGDKLTPIFRFFGEIFGWVADRLEDLADFLSLAKTKTEEFTPAINTLTTATRQVDTSLRAVATSAPNAGAGLETFGTGAGTASTAADDLATALDELRAGILDSALAGDVANLTTVFEGLDDEQLANTENAKRQVDQIQALIDRGGPVNDAMRAYATSADLAADAAARAAEKTRAFNSKVEGAITTITDGNLDDELHVWETALSEVQIAGELTYNEVMRLGAEAVTLRQRGAQLSPQLEEVARQHEYWLAMINATKLGGVTQDIKLLNEQLVVQPSLFQQLRTAWSAVPGMITKTIMQGGDAVRAVGSHFGGLIGTHLEGKLVGALTGKVGAAIGAAFGPIGAMAGQLIGKGISAAVKEGLKGLRKLGVALKGLFGRSTEDNIRIMGERMGFQFGSSMQRAIAATSTEIGHDYTAFLLHLSEITRSQGLHMSEDYQLVARTARDLWSMVEQGHITSGEAAEAIGPILEDLAAGFATASDTGQIQFYELIQVAHKMGMSLEDLRALVGSLADDALATQLSRAIIDVNGNIIDLDASIRNLPDVIHIRTEIEWDVDNVPWDEIHDEMQDIFSDIVGEESGDADNYTQGFQHGTGGRFVDFGGGQGTLVRLHGREAVVPEGQSAPGVAALAHEIRALRADLEVERTFQSQLVPKMLAAAIAQSGATN